ncbi:MAG: chromate transporter [Ktedonobacteraceae bacterium]
MKEPVTYFLTFLKASLFSTGGFSNLPSLHQDLLANGWASETNFGQAIVIGQLSPGPNGLWVISLGYLTYGYLGAALALLAITIPPLLVLGLAALYRRMEDQRWVQGMMRGISVAVVGILIAVVWSIMKQSPDWKGLLIGLAAFGLSMTGRVNIVIILLLAAGTGYVLYGLH